jgi:hypothetical protein
MSDEDELAIRLLSLQNRLKEQTGKLRDGIAFYNVYQQLDLH